MNKFVPKIYPSSSFYILRINKFLKSLLFYHDHFSNYFPPFSFVAQHDPDECSPGGEDGNFIMFARATSGDKRNNNRFSPCSLVSINPVLNAKARSSKGCFAGK